ncbi:hypothetical protein [Nitrospira sp. Ecomares 2.1]
MTFTDTLLAAIVGASVALITELLVKPFFEFRTRRSEERRWYFDHFFPLRMERLTALHAALIEWWRFVNRFSSLASTVPNNGEFRTALALSFENHVDEHQKPFDTAVAHADLYLNESARAKIKEFQEEAFIAMMQIKYILTPPAAWPDGLAHEIDRKILEDSFVNAVKELASLLSPQELHKLKA